MSLGNTVTPYPFAVVEADDLPEIAAMTIEKWITNAEAAGKDENGLGGMGGWFGYDNSADGGQELPPAHHRWADYLGNFEPKAHAMLEELRRSIVANKVRCTGYQHQNEASAVPLWSNGKVDTYSYRAWGDLMAAVWSTEEDKDYGYMDFYM
jgi:hypothetical protein